MTFSTSQWPNEIIIFVIYVEQYQEQSQFSKGLGCLQYCFCAHMVFSALLRCCDPKPSGCSDSQYHPLSPNITPFLRLLLFSHSFVSHSLWPHGLQHTRFPCLSPSPGAYSNSCPLSQWCHPTISSSVTPFSGFQSLPASGSFPMSWLFTSGSQNIGASASASVLPMNIQDWFPLRLTGLILLLSKGVSRVFSTTVQKHQFFSAQPFSWSSSHICTWILEKP